MEAMRQTWSDERMDDLRDEVRRGFDRCDVELGRVRSEVAVGFDRVDVEFGRVRGEIAQLRGEMGGQRGDMGELRGEMGGLRGEMRELRGEMGELRREMNDRFAVTEQRIDALQRTMAIGFAALGGGLLASVAATVLAAVLG